MSMPRVKHAPSTDPIRERREEEKEERRRAILDAAEKVIARDGWEATNFGEIAREARLSRTLVYVYFPTRDELFHTICRRGLRELERRFAAAAGARNGLESVMAIGRAYHQFSLDKPLYFTVLSNFQGRDVNPGDQTANEAEAHAQGRLCLTLVAQALSRGVADGSIRRSIGDPGPTAISVWAFTHGLIQIASRKEAMLLEDFGLTAAKAMEQGFKLLRGSLAAKSD